MSKLGGGRPGFRRWVDDQPDPSWELMPLTHITKAVVAEDIVAAGQIDTSINAPFDQPFAFFFYGRPAYRVGGDGAVKLEASCPCCFIFDSGKITEAAAVFAFDTGAFDKRLYKHVFLDEYNIEDFSLEKDVTRANRLIAKVFSTKRNYFEGNLSKVAKPEEITKAWDFLPRAYLELLLSKGRNEPDDRIASIEVLFDRPLPIVGNLLAVVVPHTLWDDRAPWLEQLQADNVAICPYTFVPGRPVEHYQVLLESAVRDLYGKWGGI